MILVVLIVFGLCLGSFVNALIWRIHEQAAEHKKKRPSQKRLAGLSVVRGRSICPKCQHELKAVDLIPLLSWLSTKGRCRYCHRPISIQYPLVELATAALFVGSYLFWPALYVNNSYNCPPASLFHGSSWIDGVIFGLWLAILTGLIALFVYDWRWYILPNRIVYPLTVLAATYAAITIGVADEPLKAFINTILAVLAGGGIFYALFQVSRGKWIGGGDVKLGWLLGLVLGTPAKALLMIFIAALLGSIVSVPLLANKKLKKSSIIPFGPFLIIAAIIVQLFGADILNWYQHTLLGI